jgi:hypothetical protein
MELVAEFRLRSKSTYVSCDQRRRHVFPADDPSGTLQEDRQLERLLGQSDF